MKHASQTALDRIDELLDLLRAVGSLKEKGRGVFYVKSTAFLHFHEDPAGLFADVRTGTAWERFAVNTRAEQKSLLARISAELKKQRS